MPTNKNAQLRYKVLDRCFGDRERLYSLEDLLDCVNEKMAEMGCGKVTDRTIKADIKFMRDSDGYNAPIKTHKTCDSYRGMIWCYRYDIPDFSIFNNELSEKDVADLQSVIDMLGRYRGIPAYQWIEEIVSSLKYRFGIRSRTENVVGFDQNIDLKGLDFLGTLIEAALNHQPIRVLYRSYQGNERESIIHPYFLKEYNKRWFLLGLQVGNHGNYLTNKALDRIVSVKTADVPFIENTEIDFDKYFNDIVGVTLPDEHLCKEDIVMRFDKERYPYVLSKPIHSSQEIFNDECCTVKISVRFNKELEAELLSFGSQVEVLEPMWLRERMLKKIEEMLKNYSGGKIG